MVKAILSVVVAALVVFLVLAGITATSLVGEVVTLHTREGGEWKTTPLWIVDVGTGEFLRAGNPESGWVLRYRADPSARLERRGELADVTLAEEPGMNPEVTRLMAEKYGWADDFVGLMAGDRSQALPLRVVRGP